MSDDIVIKDGYIYGGWRQPENFVFKLRTIKKDLGSSFDMDLSLNIHDDKVAKKVGMRGGTVRGTVHLNLFPPLLIKLFGNRWFENGSLSMYYTYALKPGEKVRAVIALPPEGVEEVQLEARVEMENGQIVEKGTVSLGNPKEPSYIRSLDLVNEPEELRVLAEYKVGDALPSRDVKISEALMNDILPTITDNIDYYMGESPWGEPIVTPNIIYMAMELLFAPTISKGAIPFFGATEIRNINGPVKVGVPYKATGKFVSLGQTSKTEYYWQDSFLEEKETGKLVADMRHMNRFMKATSPLYRNG